MDFSCILSRLFNLLYGPGQISTLVFTVLTTVDGLILVLLFLHLPNVVAYQFCYFYSSLRRSHISQLEKERREKRICKAGTGDRSAIAWVTARNANHYTMVSSYFRLQKFEYFTIGLTFSRIFMTFAAFAAFLPAFDVIFNLYLKQFQRPNKMQESIIRNRCPQFGKKSVILRVNGLFWPE